MNAEPSSYVARPPRRSSSAGSAPVEKSSSTSDRRCGNLPATPAVAAAEPAAAFLSLRRHFNGLAMAPPLQYVSSKPQTLQKLRRYVMKFKAIVASLVLGSSSLAVAAPAVV